MPKQAHIRQKQHPFLAVRCPKKDKVDDMILFKRNFWHLYFLRQNDWHMNSGMQLNNIATFDENVYF